MGQDYISPAIRLSSTWADNSISINCDCGGEDEMRGVNQELVDDLSL